MYAVDRHYIQLAVWGGNPMKKEVIYPAPDVVSVVRALGI